MAKKETLNPITAFRKANEARKAVVMKSLKKAQAGIAQDTTAAQQPVNKYYPWKGNVKLKTPTVKEETPDYLKPTRKYADPRMDPNYNSNPPASSQFEGPKSISTKSGKSASDILNSYNNSKKKGGVVKRKK